MRTNRTALVLVGAAISIAVGATDAARAVTRLDATYGTPSEGETARSAAMGAVGVADLQGSSAAVQNPALLSLFTGRGHLDVQLSVRQVNEDRFVPLYDTFDDRVAETAYAINRDAYASGQGGLLYRLPTQNASVFSVGLYERYDTEWSYEEEVRGAASDDLEALRGVQSDGRLRSLTLAYGAEVIDSVRFGMGVHRYFGTLETLRRVSPVSGTDTVDRLERDLSGWGWTVGALVRAGQRLSLGVSFEGPVTLDGMHTQSAMSGGSDVPLTRVPADGDYELEYPATLAFGISLHPRNQLRTVFTAEARYRWWEELEDGYLNEADALADGEEGSPVPLPLGRPVRDTWDLRGGVEHRFYNEMPLRFGFRYLQNYADRDTERVVFSAGTGYRFGEVTVDLTGQYQRQTSRQPFVFDEGASGISNPQFLPKVEDSVVRFVLGVSRTF